MQKVFSKASLAGITLGNRIVRSATHDGLADNNGNPTETLIKKYEELAKGEAGAIITGYAGVMQNGKSSAIGMLMIDSDEVIPYYQKLTERVHRLNTPIILQIAHCGRQTDSSLTGISKVAPSAIRDKLYNEDLPHELNKEEIHDIIEHFVYAILRAKNAGFDGVELHAAHGFLLSSFLSPHMNKRTDEWGGSIENRFRIIKKILDKARKTVGNYPILVKINSWEKSKDGLKIEDAVLIAKHLEESGCDAIEVSCGIAEEGFVFARGDFPFEMMKKQNARLKRIPKAFYLILKPMLKSAFASPEPKALYNLDNAIQIKKAVNIPVIVVGGIRKLSDIEDIIESEKCDFVSMSRPFIIEPAIVKKFKEEGQTESRCISCNYCTAAAETTPLKCYYGKI